MTSRNAIIGASILCCLTALAAVFIQQRQLTALRAQRQQSPDETAATSANPVETQGIPASSSSEAAMPAGELLQLRNQISRLTEQKRELSAVSAENEQLRARVAAQGTNAGAGMAVPPGYIRKSQAQWMGTGSPEDTLQSFLWALRNRNLESLLQVVTPETATIIKRQFDIAPDKFFDEAAAVPGMRIVEQKQMPDGSVRLRVEIAPNIDAKPEITFVLVDGQWKLNMR